MKKHEATLSHFYSILFIWSFYFMIFHFWAQFWPSFSFVDFWAYFGHFSLVKSATDKIAFGMQKECKSGLGCKFPLKSKC